MTDSVEKKGKPKKDKSVETPSKDDIYYQYSGDGTYHHASAYPSKSGNHYNLLYDSTTASSSLLYGSATVSAVDYKKLYDKQTKIMNELVALLKEKSGSLIYAGVSPDVGIFVEAGGSRFGPFHSEQSAEKLAFFLSTVLPYSVRVGHIGYRGGYMATTSTYPSQISSRGSMSDGDINFHST